MALVPFLFTHDLRPNRPYSLCAHIGRCAATCTVSSTTSATSGSSTDCRASLTPTSSTVPPPPPTPLLLPNCPATAQLPPHVPYESGGQPMHKVTGCIYPRDGARSPYALWPPCRRLCGSGVVLCGGHPHTARHEGAPGCAGGALHQLLCVPSHPARNPYLSQPHSPLYAWTQRANFGV